MEPYATTQLARLIKSQVIALKLQQDRLGHMLVEHEDETERTWSQLLNFMDMASAEPWLSAWVRQVLAVDTPEEVRRVQFESLRNAISAVRNDVMTRSTSVRVAELIAEGIEDDAVDWDLGPLVLSDDQVALLTAIGSAWRGRLGKVQSMSGNELIQVMGIAAAYMMADTLVVSPPPEGALHAAHHLVTETFLDHFFDQLHRFGIDLAIGEETP